MMDDRAYNDKLDAGEQIEMEERIAACLFDDYVLDEEDVQESGQKILRMVLAKFRPDLFSAKPARPRTLRDKQLDDMDDRLDYKSRVNDVDFP